MFILGMNPVPGPGGVTPPPTGLTQQEITIRNQVVKLLQASGYSITGYNQQTGEITTHQNNNTANDPNNPITINNRALDRASGNNTFIRSLTVPQRIQLSILHMQATEQFNQAQRVQLDHVNRGGILGPQPTSDAFMGIIQQPLPPAPPLITNWTQFEDALFTATGSRSLTGNGSRANREVLDRAIRSSLFMNSLSDADRRQVVTAYELSIR